MRSRSDRRALVVFVLVEVAAAGIWLSRAPQRWFSGDEWLFLADRDGGDIGDLLRPHNEHWVTTPVLIYRLLWNLVGLRVYAAYLIPVVAAHLLAAALLRVLMRRNGVDRWIATAAASAFALFGAGWFNILYSFQITLTGALAVGLAALVVADRDGPLTRVDAFGIVLCVVSLTFSGIAVVMVGTVALAVLVRRGLRVAAAYAVPPAAIFVLWSATSGQGQFRRHGTWSDVVGFVQTNLRSTVNAIGKVPGSGIVLAVILVVGLVLTFRGERHATLREVSAPLSLVVGAVVLAFTTGLGRGEGYAVPGIGADASRYLHVTAAMLLPALALAATAIATRWRFALVPMVLVFVVGIPLNVRAAFRDVGKGDEVVLAYRDQILVTARLPIAEELPPSVSAEPKYAPWVTIEWLRAGVESGRIPPPPAHPDVDLTDLLVNLVLQTVRTEKAGDLGDCVPLTEAPTALEEGQVLLARGPVVLAVEETTSAPADEVELYVLPDYSLKVVADGLTVGVRSGTVQACGP